MADLDRNKNLTWFKKQNHGKVKKSEVTKPLLLDAGVTRLSGLGYTIQNPQDGAELTGSLELEGDASGNLELEGDASGNLELEGIG